MGKIPVILIFDVGKTNKKILLYNEQYNVVHEENKQFSEMQAEDGFPCEDVNALTAWVKSSFISLSKNERFEIKAVNFSAYGASFVYLDEKGNVFLPLYNYLNPYPQDLQKKFYAKYGDENLFAKRTASPVLGNLNSGMQLYRLKYEKPDTFSKIKYALHLPQYLSYILCGKTSTDITSIGCHTALWDFENDEYHQWVKQEGILEKFSPVKNSSTIAGFTESRTPVGIGLHDSSSALIPYLSSFTDPFVLISTGTWSISLNPFNHSPLSDDELKQDCLCYLSFEGKPVKASRLFAGQEHDEQVKRLSTHFNTDPDYFKNVKYDVELKNKLRIEMETRSSQNKFEIGQFIFDKRDLGVYKNFEEAYHQLIADIIKLQVQSTSLVLKGTSVKKIFVDGGFSQNYIYMQMLTESFPEIEIFAASIPQASALGAALVFHQHWNRKELPMKIIDLKLYSIKKGTVL